MQTYNVLIVEDELLIGNHIKNTIEKENFICVGIAVSYNEAITYLNSKKIDIILLDINLFGDKTGIDLANYINIMFKIPFIYLTSYSDTETISELKKTYPVGYLSKPINSVNLTTTLSIACNNLFKTVPLTIGKKTYHVEVNKLLFVSSDHVYLELNFTDKKEVIRATLQSVLNMLPENFKKVNRSTFINSDKIERIESNNVYLNNGSSFKISEKFIKSFKS